MKPERIIIPQITVVFNAFNELPTFVVYSLNFTPVESVRYVAEPIKTVQSIGAAFDDSLTISISALVLVN